MSESRDQEEEEDEEEEGRKWKVIRIEEVNF